MDIIHRGGINMARFKMSDVIGREAEQKRLERAFQSEQAEFIAVYGRRRVGKTYLVRNHFSSKKQDSIFFYVTGMKDGTMLEQIKNFTEEIGEAFLYAGARLETQKNWRDTFRVLTDTIKASSAIKKIVLFFDEFPWMVTKNSRLLQTLEYYWNHHWSRDQRIKLIICGSASGWILKNIVNNKGGLYNRVTDTIHLEPFDLYKTKRYLNHLKITLSNKQITHLYMVLGGIPFYLSKLEPGLSAVQSIEQLAFSKGSFLLNEFENLYATLFGVVDSHIGLAKIISRSCYGVGQAELVREVKNTSSGGRLVDWLKDLEQAGFIIRFKPFCSSRKGIYYKIIDEYSLFYFKWIESLKESLLERGMRQGYWESLQSSAAWYSWAGYAFEALCYKHIAQISTALRISPTAIPYSWRYVPAKGSIEQGAEIDLLFDRDDDSMTICEIKYTNQPFAIDKAYAEILKRKIEVFKKITKTRKQVFLVMISASGIKETMYSEEILSGVVTLDDLFIGPLQ
jgi:predicted AAA+ superfamily ATPase